jgi:hypothetical protein
MNKASGQETLFDNSLLYYFLFFTTIQKKIKLIRSFSNKSIKPKLRQKLTFFDYIGIIFLILLFCLLAKISYDLIISHFYAPYTLPEHEAIIDRIALK